MKKDILVMKLILVLCLIYVTTCDILVLNDGTQLPLVRLSGNITTSIGTLCNYQLHDWEKCDIVIADSHYSGNITPEDNTIHSIIYVDWACAGVSRENNYAQKTHFARYKMDRHDYTKLTKKDYTAQIIRATPQRMVMLEYVKHPMIIPNTVVIALAIMAVIRRPTWVTVGISMICCILLVYWEDQPIVPETIYHQAVGTIVHLCIIVTFIDSTPISPTLSTFSLTSIVVYSLFSLLETNGAVGYIAGGTRYVDLIVSQISARLSLIFILISICITTISKVKTEEN
jgi:hypothetical protein